MKFVHCAVYLKLFSFNDAWLNAFRRRLAFCGQYGRIAIAAVLVCLSVGCDGMQYRQNLRKNFEADQGDFNSIAKASFKMIDPNGAITTAVVSASIDNRARAALKRILTVVDATQVPSSQVYKLPEGYFLVQKFSIADGEAILEGQLGPVTNTLTAANLPDCGKLYTVVYYLEAGDWVSHSYKVTTCAESRHWVPVGAPQENQVQP